MFHLSPSCTVDQAFSPDRSAILVNSKLTESSLRTEEGASDDGQSSLVARARERRRRRVKRDVPEADMAAEETAEETEGTAETEDPQPSPAAPVPDTIEAVPASPAASDDVDMSKLSARDRAKLKVAKFREKMEARARERQLKKGNADSEA